MAGKPQIEWVRIAPLLLLVSFIGLAPFGSAFYNAFFHDIYGERSFAGLDNFRRFFGSEDFGYSFRISLFWALLNTSLSLVLGFWFASILAGRRRLSRLFYLILLIPWGIPVYIAVPLWRVLLHGSGGRSILTFLFGLRLNLLIDPVAGFLSALIVSLWTLVPLTAFVLAGAMQKVSRATVQAAQLEGASRIQISLNLILPQIRGSLLVMAVLGFLKSFKEFTVIFLMTNGGPPLVTGITERSIIGATTTLEIYLYEMFQSSEDLGVPSAFSAVMAGLVVVVMVLWFFARSDRRGESAPPGADQGKEDQAKTRDKRRIIPILVAATQLLFGGLYGLPWTAAYLASFRWRRLYPWVLGAQLLVMIGRLALQGYPAGIDPGLAIAFVGLLLVGSGTRRASAKQGISIPGKGFDIPWRIGSGTSALFMGIGSLAILYLVIWLSASRLSSAYIDSLIPPFFSLESYRKILVEEGILRFARNSLIIGAATACLVPLITFPAASYLAGRRSRITLGVITFVQVVSISGGMHSLIPLYALFRSLGLLNSYLPLVLIYSAHAVPFSLLAATVYLEGLPRSLWENARIEGMSAGSYLVRILAPLSFPVIAATMMVAFLGAWNGFLAPLLLLNDDARYTISIKLYSLVGSIASADPKWNLFAAASVLNILFLFLIFSRFRRPLQQSPLAYYED